MGPASLATRLLCAHVFADYVFQSEVMARWKSVGAEVPASAGKWWWWLWAHGVVNGALVWLATGSLWCFWYETLLHVSIDHLKCTHRISPNADQVCHLVCKLLWGWMTWRGMV